MQGRSSCTSEKLCIISSAERKGAASSFQPLSPLASAKHLQLSKSKIGRMRLPPFSTASRIARITVRCSPSSRGSEARISASTSDLS